jgi:hypothetical protein
VERNQEKSAKLNLQKMVTIFAHCFWGSTLYRDLHFLESIKSLDRTYLLADKYHGNEHQESSQIENVEKRLKGPRVAVKLTLDGLCWRLQGAQ